MTAGGVERQNSTRSYGVRRQMQKQEQKHEQKQKQTQKQILTAKAGSG